MTDETTEGQEPASRKAPADAEKVSDSTGAWVVRRARENSPFVQQLLSLLQQKNCKWAPKPGGMARDGRERVGFIEGLVDWELRAVGKDPASSTACATVFRWIRYLHDITLLSDLGTPGQVVKHGDLGPHNVIYDGTGVPVGLIDWDFAEPGSREDDLAVAIKEFTVLGARSVEEDAALSRVALQSYGFDAVDLQRLAAALPRAFDADLEFCLAQADAGNDFFLHWRNSGQSEVLTQRRDTVVGRMDRYIEALGSQ